MTTQQLSPAQRVAILLGVAIALVMLTRLPLVPSRLFSFDDVNFAIALKDFDPTRNQPQPPGYPFFVAETRLLNAVLGTPERTFPFLGNLIGGLAVGFLYLLGRRMFSPAVGLVAAALLFVNPCFYLSGLTSPLRPHLALISALMAYFCWRAATGEPRYFYAASLVLGLGSGFRPELLLLLFPLWAWTAWQCGQARLFFGGAAMIGASVIVWVVVLAIACGGLAQMMFSFFQYSFEQTQQTSVLLDPRSSTWLHWAGRAVLWNGLGALPWIWTLPFGWSRLRELPEWKRILTFLAVWFVPAFAFFLLVHIGEPDHTLTTVVALCVAGAYCLVSAGEAIGRKWCPELNDAGGIAVWIALIGNMLFFFAQFEVPQREPAPGFHGWQSVHDAVLIGTYEASYSKVRWVDQMTTLALDRIQKLKSSTQQPVLLLSGRDAQPSWRTVSFYLPSEKVYSIEEAGDPATPTSIARLWSGKTQLEKYTGAAPIQVPVPKGARLIWLIAPASVNGLRKIVPLQDASPVYYTDLAPDAASFRWGTFEFVPQ